MPRRKTNEGDPKKSPSFEESLAGLESIVEAMEHEELPLEELVAYYEKGSALLDRCETLLQGARERIELITLRDKGAAGAEQTAADAPQAETSEETDNDDIRLF